MVPEQNFNTTMDVSEETKGLIFLSGVSEAQMDPVIQAMQ